MSTDREREALARLLYDRREGTVANQDFARQSRLWDECLFHAETVLAAGWMPRPEPGSAEWEAMVERAIDAGENADLCGDPTCLLCRRRMDDMLRAALGTGDQK